MRIISFIFLQFLIVSAVVSAGSITTSVSDFEIFPAGKDVLFNYSTNGSVCLTPYMSAQNCSTAQQTVYQDPAHIVVGTSGSASSATPSGAAQASQSGPYYPDGYRSGFPFTAQGQLAGSFPGAESSTVDNGRFLWSTFNSLAVYPNIVIDFNPTGANGSADASASEISNTPFEARGEVTFSVRLFGDSAASFILDPTTNTMSLTTSGDASGYISLFYGLTCPACDGGPHPVTSGWEILYGFQNGIVTASSNSLGLALPTVGSQASFALGSVSPFGYVFPKNSFFPGFDSVTNSVSQDANLVAPEPGAYFLTLAGLGALLLRKARR